jgi:hypothetical protein
VESERGGFVTAATPRERFSASGEVSVFFTTDTVPNLLLLLLCRTQLPAAAAACAYLTPPQTGDVGERGKRGERGERGERGAPSETLSPQPAARWGGDGGVLRSKGLSYDGARLPRRCEHAWLCEVHTHTHTHTHTQHSCSRCVRAAAAAN